MYSTEHRRNLPLRLVGASRTVAPPPIFPDLMDPKAAAKSKRSHTVHGRRAHQTPAAAAAHRQKRAAAAAASSAPRSRNLPSNWDRYDDEGEAEEPASAVEWTGEVAPRSKGADFGFLLEQARAQPREARGLRAPWLPSQDLPFGE